MSRLTDFFGSILGRLLVLIGGISCMFVAAMVIALGVFQATGHRLQDLSENRVPWLVSGQALSREISAVQANLPAMLSAPDAQATNAAHTALVDHLSKARGLGAALPGGTARDTETLLSDATDALDRLAAARILEFEATAETARQLSHARSVAQQASAALETATDDTYFEVVLGGEATMRTGADALTRLIYEDVALLQSTLEARSQFEALLGAALGATRTPDRDLAPVLEDVAQAAGMRLQRLVPLLERTPSTAPAAQAISDTVPRLLGVFGAAAPMSPGQVLDLRARVELPLVTAIDDLTFDLTLQSEAATEQSQRAMDRLLHRDVAALRDRAHLDHATLEVVITAFDLALSRDATTLGMLQGTLEDKVRKLDRLLHASEADLRAALEPVLALADARTGLAPTRAAALEARTRAAEAATAATGAVMAVSVAVNEMMSGAVATIDQTSSTLNAEMRSAKARLSAISAVSAAFLLLAPVLAWVLIARPLGRITATTDRLAQGDLTELSGLPARGEMGRLAGALETFRAAALQQIATQRAKDAAEAEARTRALEAAAERQQAERAAHAAELARAASEQQQRDAEAARARALREAADAERQARAQEQAHVVTSLAAGLQKLACGDLGARIDTAFPPAYDGLRTDFNGAVANLSALIEDLHDSARRIDENTREIANGARDLSRRTEANASTLEETAAAIADLTEAAAQQASGAAEADRTARSAHEGAQDGRDIVLKAVETMDTIRASSEKIGTITSMIEDIAFQTNLLALNAGVEAARAGPAGKGFAVVASEVRALSQRSAKAAKDISALLRESSNQIVEGVSRVGRAHRSLEEIIGDVHSVTQRIGSISTSAEDQKTTITGLNGAIRALDQDTQANAAMFEETQAATEGLAQEAKRLAARVSSFSLPPPARGAQAGLAKSA